MDLCILLLVLMSLDVFVMIWSAICKHLSTWEIKHKSGMGGENVGGVAVHQGEAVFGRSGCFDV